MELVEPRGLHVGEFRSNRFRTVRNSMTGIRARVNENQKIDDAKRPNVRRCCHELAERRAAVRGVVLLMVLLVLIDRLTYQISSGDAASDRKVFQPSMDVMFERGRRRERLIL